MDKLVVIVSNAESREERDHQDILAKMIADMGPEVYLSAPTGREESGETDDFIEQVGGTLKEAREKIARADCLLVDWDGENPNGIFEAGSAFQAGRPVVTLSSGYEDLPAALRGISDEVVIYENYSELKTKLLEYFSKNHIM